MENFAVQEKTKKYKKYNNKILKSIKMLHGDNNIRTILNRELERLS